MARFYGIVGFCKTVTDEHGVTTEEKSTRPYYGDIVHRSTRWDNASQIIDNINVNSSISIVADEFATRNFNNIRYVECWGSKWKVTTVEPQYPRLILQIGGVYNE